MSDLLRRIADTLIAGDIQDVVHLTEEALESGVPALEVVDNGLLAGMRVVGERFKEGELFIPEVLHSAKAMQEAMDILRPFLCVADAVNVGTVVLGTVKGDLHDIGKNLVGMMFETAGFRVVDLGTDVDAKRFVEASKEHRPDIVGLSALLTTTMRRMRDTISGLHEAGIRDQIKVMIGGSPVTEAFAEMIGADGYAPDAATAVDRGKRLLRLE